MMVLVCGSVEWQDWQPIQTALAMLPPGSIVMHGAARGADRIAGSIARKLGFEVRAYPALWRRYGRGAGLIRNAEMIALGPELVLAFQLNQSRGTQHTIDLARKAGIPVLVMPLWKVGT